MFDSSAGIGRILLYFAASWGGILAGWVVDRFGKGIRTAPRDAPIAEVSQDSQLGRSLGLHMALDTLGAVAGIALTYFLFTWT
jgi:hypothetical protein